MRKLSIFGLALACSMALAPAFAQEDSASGKHFAVTAGGASLSPRSEPTTGIGIKSAVAPTMGFTWYVNDYLAVEAWGAVDRFTHKVRAIGEGELGTVDQQPIALSAQYHITRGESPFRPFVGAGYYQSNFSRETLTTEDNEHIGLSTPKGVIGTVGVDYNFTPNFFLRADARYLRARNDLLVNGVNSGTSLKLDPWMFGVSMGTRF